MKNDRKIEIMGIVNLTDNSYFAESRCVDVASAMEKVAAMVDEGADIIDIGACSTKPGSVPVGAEQEWGRLQPVLNEIRISFPMIRVSVDTYWSEIVLKTYDLIGDFIVNDISAGEDDPKMLSVVGGLGLEYVAMHKRGTPQTMQSLTDYTDVTAAVKEYFMDFSRRASSVGLEKWILDPGFGFAKTVEQNWELMKNLECFKCDYSGFMPRVLVGISRKSMIYRPLNITPEEALPATQAAHMFALMSGADILRVHDVAAAAQTISLYKNTL